MTGEPIKLATRPPLDALVRQQAVDMLRAALAQAEAGEIAWMFMVVGRPNGNWSQRDSGGMDALSMVGAIELAKTEFILKYFQQTEQRSTS